MKELQTGAAVRNEAEFDRRVASLVSNVIEIEREMTALGLSEAVPHLEILRSYIAAKSVALMDAVGASPGEH